MVKQLLRNKFNRLKLRLSIIQATIDLKVEAMIDGKVKDVAKELKSLRDLLIDRASTKPKKFSG